MLKLIAEIGEFKGHWKVMESLPHEKLTRLRRIPTIESVGSSTHIEGTKLRAQKSAIGCFRPDREDGNSH